MSWSSAFRRINKRRLAVATATPYSVSIVGSVDSYFYRNGVLSYTTDGNLRILDMYKSNLTEIVINISRLIQNVASSLEPCLRGHFRILYHNDNIIACLYHFLNPTAVKILIAIDTRAPKILFTYDLPPNVDRIFVRLNKEVLYYGTYGYFGLHGYKCWALRGYRFEDREKCVPAGWFDARLVLHSLLGSLVGQTICFEIHEGYFYAVSNQTTREVEEVDWTSFYHAVRFPIESPDMSLLEMSEDDLMWRRQHLEGPIDDRWTDMRLDVDEATGNLRIIELRNEWLFGGSKSQRTFYTKEIVFKQKSMDQILHSAIVSSSKAPSTISTLLSSLNSTTFASSKSPGSPILYPASQVLSELTKDRLALTVTPHDNPHYLPPQTRLPRNIHSTHENRILFSKVHLSYYNSQANSYIDLINDPRPRSPTTQRLRLCVGSRRRLPIARTESSQLLVQSIDPLTGEVMEGLEERFTENTVSSWPPDWDTYIEKHEKFQDLDEIMNSQDHVGEVQAVADDRCIVYTTGLIGQLKALVLVNFDPAVQLKGLQKWNTRHAEGNTATTECMQPGVPPAAKISPLQQCGEARRSSTASDTSRSCAKAALPDHERVLGGSQKQSWILTEPAMYLAINRGYEFNHLRRGER